MENFLKTMTLSFFGNGLHKIQSDKFFEMSDAVFLDVRSLPEVRSFSINLDYHRNIEYLNIPVENIPDRLEEIPKERFIALFCPSSIRAAMVYSYLRIKGFQDVRILEGGYVAIADEMRSGKILKRIKSK